MQTDDQTIEEIADHYTPGHTDGPGVRHDELMEYAILASDYESRWEDVCLHMDAMIDGGELLPSEVIDEVVPLHRTAQEMVVLYGKLHDELRNRQEALADAEADR